jgi:hypothetical protein
MSKFVFVYAGGTDVADEDRSSIEQWGAWFQSLGSAVADIGHPVGASTAVGANGATSASSTGVAGYSVIEADSLDIAAKLATECPIIADGGRVEVFETIAM